MNKMTSSAPVPPELAARVAEADPEQRFLIPPPVFLEMGGEFVDVDLTRKQVTVRFPIEHRFLNPLGTLQGGIIAALADNAIGPLSFMVAPPSVTKQMTIDYVQPVTDMASVDVTARFESAEGRTLNFSAELHTRDGTTLARIASHNVIIRRDSNPEPD